MGFSPGQLHTERMINIHQTILSVIGGLPVIVMSTPAHAHHSFTANYDSGTTIEISGVVADFRLISPHSSIVVDVANADGSVERWTVESNSANSLRRMGWDENTISNGGVITVIGMPHRRSPLQMHGTQFITPDGTAPARRSGDELVAAYPPDPDARGFAGRWVPQRRGASGPPGSPLPLTAAGLEAWRNYDSDTSLVTTCEPMNIPTLFYASYLLDIRMNDQEVVLDHELYDVTRKVPLNAAPVSQHESGLFGVASGRMQGSDLVIESSGYPPSQWGLAVAVLRNGNGGDVPSSGQKKMTERYSVSGDGKTLRLEFTVEDPVYLTEPFSDDGEWRRIADDAPIVYDYACDSDSAALFTGLAEADQSSRRPQ